MGEGLQTRGEGEVLFARLGSIHRREQSDWNRAPLSHGTWAFPWPYFEMFFAWHQYELQMPKRLRKAPRELGIPYLHASAYEYEGKPAERVPTKDEWEDYDTPWGIRQGMFDEKDEWVKNVGRRTVKMRKFWYSGNLYTHLTSSGGILGLDEWMQMDARTYADAVRKSGGNTAWYRYNGQLNQYHSSVDHLEVFIAGKVK